MKPAKKLVFLTMPKIVVKVGTYLIDKVIILSNYITRKRRRNTKMHILIIIFSSSLLILGESLV